ncbi:MAG: rhodanese-like domain-containing protein [Anaerolineae bacterium]|nr:rhodanese-like domain-containing protein [Anaerolineae bacterium]
MQGPEPPTAAPPARPVSLTPAEAEERLAGGGAILLDVRDSYEWTNPGHVAGATLIPLGQLARRVGELDPKKEIIVMCNNGSRSKSGLQILQNAGFAHLAELEGGIQAWIAQGLPVSREN